jgi:hypothetical protein
MSALLDRMADWALNHPSGAVCGLLLIILMVVVGALAWLEKRNPMDDGDI